MKGKSHISPGMVRRKVREVLNMRPGRGKTEDILLEFVNELTAGGVDVQMLREAIEWNLSEGYVRYVDGGKTESGEKEWFITRAGQEHENIT